VSHLEKIDLSAVSTITDFADLSANHLNQIGADTVISDGAGNAVKLSNIAAADLQAADFIF
jgi:hypothetical protein